ncbi:1,4-dihydroxy-2-naphthoate octaprenyltransferase [Acidimicrobiaceae bacterium]|nr:1,4-dihydroxy-2-naphthoate octaprenyltransferase [Acidimicrobiaceae bacterium]
MDNGRASANFARGSCACSCRAACVFIDTNSERAWPNSFLALIVSLALQIAVNYANDYSDGVRGTDLQRVGPMRLVGSGAKKPVEVKRAAFFAFGVAALFGLILAVMTTWWLLVVWYCLHRCRMVLYGGSNHTAIMDSASYSCSSFLA